LSALGTGDGTFNFVKLFASFFVGGHVLVYREKKGF
jgi:hypothetical protein